VKAAEVAELYRRLAERTPEPKTELQYVNTYTLLVAVVLSAQATDASVNIATRELFKTVNTPQAMIEYGEERLRETIKTIGLFNTKAKNVILLSKLLVEQFDGRVPEDRDLLMALPGGRAEDGQCRHEHGLRAETFRRPTRTSFACRTGTGPRPGKNPLEVELKLDKVTPPPHRRDAHQPPHPPRPLRLQGATPECWRCVIATSAATSPRRRHRAARRKRGCGRRASAAPSGRKAPSPPPPLC
jgi:endonuclease-3